jgi:hypothetical protein
MSKEGVRYFVLVFTDADGKRQNHRITQAEAAEIMEDIAAHLKSLRDTP